MNAGQQASCCSRGLSRLPRLWRLAGLTYFPSRSWGLIGVASLLTVVPPVVGGDPLGLSVGTLVYSSAGIALLMARGIIAGDRTQARWAIVQQQPVSLMRHYGRRLLLASGALMSILTGIGLSVGVVIMARGGSISQAGGVGAGSLLWGFFVFITGVAVSSWHRKSDLEVTLFVVVLAIIQGLYPAGIRPFVAFSLLPVDGVFSVWRRMLGEQTLVESIWLTQLATYPILALVVAAIGVRRLDRLDLERVTGGS